QSPTPWPNCFHLCRRRGTMAVGFECKRSVLQSSEEHPMRLARAFSAIFLLFFATVSLAKPPEVVLPVGHEGPISSAGFSPDGTMVVTGSQDGSVVLWDVRSGEPLRRWVNHTYAVCTLGFVNGMDGIISASLSGPVVIWESGSGALVREIKVRWFLS